MQTEEGGRKGLGLELVLQYLRREEKTWEGRCGQGLIMPGSA